MNKHDHKVPIYDQFARIGKALSAPARLELLDLLAQGERSVDALAKQAHLPIANASQHLQVLAAAHLVDTRRDGQRIYYRLAGPSVAELWLALRSTAEAQLADLPRVAQAYLGDGEQLEAIDRHELARRIDAGSVVVIDVRPAEEYAHGHIPGALSVPLDALDAWAAGRKSRKQIVAYCRGPYCVYAVDAVARLTRRGLRAVRARDGVTEWRAAGYPVEEPSAST